MCGRYYLNTSKKKLAEHFHIADAADIPDIPPRFNVAPSQNIPVVRQSEKGREVTMMRWGLLPSWSEDAKAKFSMINARAETVAEKPAYRAAFKKRRCLIPASGFYEWQPSTTGKQPYVIRRKDEGILALAGIWEHWEGGGEVIESCSIIVTAANTLMAPLHDRMPVILAPDTYSEWLRTEAQSTNHLQGMLIPYPLDDLEAYPVSKRVNKPDNDGPDLIMRS